MASGKNSITISVEPEAQEWLERLERVRADLASIADIHAELDAERENADRLAKALRIAVDELCGQLHGPVSAVFEGAFDALQQHEARREK